MGHHSSTLPLKHEAELEKHRPTLRSFIWCPYFKGSKGFLQSSVRAFVSIHAYIRFVIQLYPACDPYRRYGLIVMFMHLICGGLLPLYLAG